VSVLDSVVRVDCIVYRFRLFAFDTDSDMSSPERHVFIALNT